MTYNISKRDMDVQKLIQYYYVLFLLYNINHNINIIIRNFIIIVLPIAFKYKINILCIGSLSDTRGIK